MAGFAPQLQVRQQAILPEQTALLFVDCQNYNCHRSGAEYAESSGGHSAEELAYWWQQMERVQPKWQQLQQACRDAQVEVIYTVMQSLTKDGRDRSLDYKISGFHIPPNTFDAQVCDCIKPGEDEMTFSKTSSSVFISTNLDYVLRCLGTRQLIMAGCLTDQCVESAVRDACDLHYLVTLVTDCCATYSQERHTSSLKAIQGYCRQRDLQELMQELQKNKR
ncbi:hypothetical protein WJX73_005918 [Symbiochloris irregularis]|uniref:Isochorismatase-like domain-containing protein n=1 Tax=Symbiochloris irregularis TaxID=706552 RepID=A0AAW1NUK5_9CHLO